MKMNGKLDRKNKLLGAIAARDQLLSSVSPKRKVISES